MSRSYNLIKSPSELIKKAQDFIEQVFQEQKGEGEIIQQSPVWMRATTWGLWNGNIYGTARDLKQTKSLSYGQARASCSV